MLYDRLGQLMVKTTRTMNRLYKVTLQKPKALNAYTLQHRLNHQDWHARLGHINTGTMKKMINKELVIGIPNCTSLMVDGSNSNSLLV